MSHKSSNWWCTSQNDLANILPQLNFFKVAAETPVAILDGVTHYLVEAKSVDDFYFVFENIHFRLTRAQSLMDLEDQYFETCAEEIEQYQTQYLQEIEDKRIQSIRQLKKTLAQKNVLAFLLMELVPKFIELNPGKDTLEEQRCDKVEQTLHRLLESKPESQQRTSSILEQIIGSTAIIIDGRVFPLLPASPQAEADLILQVNGTHLGLAMPGRFLNEMEFEFMSQLTDFLQEQALLETPERIRLLQDIETEEQRLLEYLGPQNTSFEDGDCLYQDQQRGIIRQNKVFYAYEEVPPYIVEDSDGTLYRFDSTRVGIAIKSCDPAKVLVPGNAVVLTPYEHMFVSSRTTGSSICMVKEPEYYKKLQQLSFKDAVCQYLFDARQTLLSGHHAGNTSSPYHSISSFGQRRVDRSEALRIQLPIYPYHR